MKRARGYFHDHPTRLQWSVLVVSLAHVAWATAGLVANPSFAIGDAAISVQVLGMDYNGWHAVAGLALFAPGLVLARDPRWSRLYVLALVPSGLGPAVWAVFDDRPLGLLAFENPVPDIVLHTTTAALMAALLLADLRAHPAAPFIRDGA